MPIDKRRYPADWESISLRIRERDNQRCQHCGAPNGEWITRDVFDHRNYRVISKELIEGIVLTPDQMWPVKVILTVHHIGICKPDGSPGSPHDKMDCRDENLISLCQRCHWIADLPIHIQAAQQALRKRRHEKRYEGMNPLFTMECAK